MRLRDLVVVAGLAGVLAFVPSPPAPARVIASPPAPLPRDVAARPLATPLLAEPTEAEVVEHILWNRQATCQDACSQAMLSFRNTPQEAGRRRQCSDFQTSTIFRTARITSLYPVATVFVRRQQVTTGSCVFQTGYVFNTYRGPQPSFIAACGPGAAQYRTACSCLGITAGSRTIDAAAAATTSAVQKPAVCYYGIDWAFYHFPAAGFPQNPTADGGTYPLFSQVVLDIVRTSVPTAIGHTNRIGGATTNAGDLVYPVSGGLSIYGTAYTGDQGNWVIVHTGYLHVDEIGTYTFSSSSAADLVLFYFNGTAVSGYTPYNANIRRTKAQNTGPAPATTFTFTATAAFQDAHIPFRVIAVRASAADSTAAWSFTITSPTTPELNNAAITANDDILRFCYDCLICKSIAPRFMEWEPLMP